MQSSKSAKDWSKGAGYVDGVYSPISEAKIPVTDWGYRRSDVTYDVVGVYYGAFFRLEDHIQRFRASMDKLRLKPKESDKDIAEILHVPLGTVQSRISRGVAQLQHLLANRSGEGSPKSPKETHG